MVYKLLFFVLGILFFIYLGSLCYVWVVLIVVKFFFIWVGNLVVCSFCLFIGFDLNFGVFWKSCFISRKFLRYGDFYYFGLIV